MNVDVAAPGKRSFDRFARAGERQDMDFVRGRGVNFCTMAQELPLTTNFTRDWYGKAHLVHRWGI